MKINSSSERELTADNNPIYTAMGVYITIHGHFYQPPRENPYLNTIERQPSASPFHNWNERIYHECYRTNVFARIFNDQGEIVGIVNNFEYLSFNIGATLMSWLENYDLEVYQKIIEADQKSSLRLNGHGNAIAQVYNHIILPLANERDKYTQIRWGKEDFRKRFGRETEGMWLAETAVDLATIKALIDENIKFIILAPTQAYKCREIATEENSSQEWFTVAGGQIDPTRPYRCYINDTEYIDIFFYDGPISGDIGFGDVLNSSANFVSRLKLAIRGDHRTSQIISVGTDGETFGHHKRDREKCLAYALTKEFPAQNWTVTNFAHYLSINPPTWEVQLKPVTAWSCSHGVGRWQDDCGCGGGDGIQLKWRRPLREALNWLRDELIKVYEDKGYQFFHNPWDARNDYIKVILHRNSEVIQDFLNNHANHSLNAEENIDAFRLLEMQRNALLMFTSCGWFFEEISRPEGTQILRYAARALELAGEIAGIQLEKEFLVHLTKAPSNSSKFANGAEIYHKLVVTSQVTFEQVAAHYAISSLFTNYQSIHQLYCYTAYQLDYQKQQIGSLTLAIGQVKLVSNVTGENTHYIFAVLHLGGWDFHCCIQPFNNRLFYTQVKDQLFDSFKQASIVEIILTMSKLFGNKYFDLKHLFVEERRNIIEQLTDSTKKRLDQLYTQVYRENYSILQAFQQDDLPVPQELQVAADIAISYRCLQNMTDLEKSFDDLNALDIHLLELMAIATEANHLQCDLKIPIAKEILDNLIFHLLGKILKENEAETLDQAILAIEKMITIGKELKLNLSLDKPQELFFSYLHSEIIPQCFSDIVESNASCPWQKNQLRILFKLGEILSVNVSPFLKYVT